MKDDIRWAVKRFHYWCDRLEEFSEPFVVKKIQRPKLVFSLKGGRVAGTYVSASHAVVLRLPYLAMLKQRYDEVIAHEVCHAYQIQMMYGCKWHGDFFLFLLRRVCGFQDAIIRHRYRTKPTKILSKVLTLHKDQLMEICKDEIQSFSMER